MPRRQPQPIPVIPEPAKLFFTDPYEWRNFTDGTYEEYTFCDIMRKRVILPIESTAMAEHGLTLEDMLNGRFGSEDNEAFVQWCFDAWNTRLGHKLFSF
jgi:hypothetical protein